MSVVKVHEPRISQRLGGLKQFHQLCDLSVTGARGLWEHSRAFMYTNVKISLIFFPSKDRGSCWCELSGSSTGTSGHDKVTSTSCMKSGLFNASDGCRGPVCICGGEGLNKRRNNKMKFFQLVLKITKAKNIFYQSWQLVSDLSFETASYSTSF